ncbi:MAG: transporter permease [Eubacterium sp.]|jgi:NitT/TauT family transport system permease protein|nr:transporter permease [Eubacterium sp.]
MNKSSSLIKSVKKVAISSISIILFIALWQLSSSIGILNKAIIPQPIDTFYELYRKIISGTFIYHAGISLKRAGIGFLYALIIGIAAGFLFGSIFKSAYKVITPLLKLLEKLNPFALFPIFMMLFGIGETCKEVLIFWVSVWPVLFHTISGVNDIEQLMIKSAKAMGATDGKLFFKVILPATAPDIFTGIKLGVQIAFFMIISAEIVGSTAGLGWFIWISQRNYQIISLYAGTIFIAILGIIINKIFAKLEGKFLVWKQSAFEITE